MRRLIWPRAIEQAKALGLVQQAIERAGVPGHRVASLFGAITARS